MNGSQNCKATHPKLHKYIRFLTRTGLQLKNTALKVISLLATYSTSMVSALSIGFRKRLVISSVNNSEQCNRKLCITDRAPALPSSVTCQVNASPRAFSDFKSFSDCGNELRHSSNILGSRPFTTGTPRQKYRKLIRNLQTGKISCTKCHNSSNEQPTSLNTIQ